MVRWYYSTNGKAEGPVTFDFLVEQLKAGKFTLVDLCFKEGESAWKTFGEIPELRDVYQAPPPFVPPVPQVTPVSQQPPTHDIDLDDISIDDFTPTPILSQMNPATTAVPVNRDEPVHRVTVAAPVNPTPTPTPIRAPASVPEEPKHEPISNIVVPESMSVNEFQKPEEGWPSDWRLSSSWIVLRKRGDGSGYDQEGPYSAEHIIEMIGTGKIEYSQYCWKPGYTRWFRIGNLPEFDRRKRDRDNDTVNQIISVPSISEALPALTREELLANVERLRRDKKQEKAPPESTGKNLIETPLDKVTPAPVQAKKKTPEPVIKVDFDHAAIAPAPAPVAAASSMSFDAPAAPMPSARKPVVPSKCSSTSKYMKVAVATAIALVAVFVLMQLATGRSRQPASQPPVHQQPKRGKVSEVVAPPVAAPTAAPEPPKAASSLEINPKALETAALLAFQTDAAPTEKIAVHIKGKTGEFIGSASYDKTFEVLVSAAQLDLVKEGLGTGTYFVEASVGAAKSSTQIFIGKNDDAFLRDLERHIKTISLRQQNEKTALYYGAQKLEKLAKDLTTNGQTFKALPLKWKRSYVAWKREAREASLPVITLAQSPVNDKAYPEQISAFQAVTEKLAAQAKEIDGAIMQKREIASVTPPEELALEFAKVREESAKLSGRPQASN